MSNKISLVIVFSVAIGLIYAIISLRICPDSLYDEGFLFLNLQEAAKGNVGGMTQWTNIIYAILGPKICSTILNLRIVRLCLTLLTALLFWFITSPILCQSKKTKFQYLLLVFFFTIPTTGGIVISYNGIAQFCLILSIAFLIVIVQQKTNQSLWRSFVVGVLLVFSLFAILPSAIIITLCIISCVLIRYARLEKKHCLYILGALLGGCFVGLFLVNCFIADLSVVFDAMKKTASNVTTLNRGYDPASFVVKLMLFLRDVLLCICVSLGIYRIALSIKAGGHRLIASIFFIFCMVVYGIYQQKPQITISMLYLSFLIVPYIIGDTDNDNIKINDLLTFDNILLLFLLFTPLLCSFGTNVYLGGKMSYFMIPWSFVAWKEWNNKQGIPFQFESVVGVSILLLIPFVKEAQKNVDNIMDAPVEEGPLAGMSLTVDQHDHFELVDSILQQYDYDKRKSYIFTTQLSTMTVCYLDGLSCGHFFQPMDFLAYGQKDKLPIPDFLFLCQYDLDVAGEEIHSMPWGWPEEFDVYMIGTPEAETRYPTERKLYCRKR